MVSFPQLRCLNDNGDLEFQRESISSMKNNDNLQRYFSASDKIGQHLQEKIDFQVTDGKLNNACVRNLLDLLFKIFLRRQNHVKIVFKDISKILPTKFNSWYFTECN